MFGADIDSSRAQVKRPLDECRKSSRLAAIPAGKGLALRPVFPYWQGRSIPEQFKPSV
jgi:hypothetical protein